MAHHLRITVSCPDDEGLLATVMGRLFDLGAHLADTSFAVLGEAAELACVCTVPDEVSVDQVQGALRELSALARADVSVRAFDLGADRGPKGTITHRITVRGEDRPGLVARLAEGFAEFSANIVRMDAHRIPAKSKAEYVVRFEVFVPGDRVDACLANTANTAEQMGLAFDAERL